MCLSTKMKSVSENNQFGFQNSRRWRSVIAEYHKSLVEVYDLDVFPIFRLWAPFPCALLLRPGVKRLSPLFTHSKGSQRYGLCYQWIVENNRKTVLSLARHVLTGFLNFYKHYNNLINVVNDWGDKKDTWFLYACSLLLISEKKKEINK